MARKAKQPRGKKMNPTFFVFCEGKTEAAYVDLLRRSFRMPVEIIAKVSDSNINQQYIDRCKRDRFTTKEDKTFLMFDLDVAGMLERLQKIDDAILLLSNPCIEYWFLLHYPSIEILKHIRLPTPCTGTVPEYSGSISSEKKAVLSWIY